MKSVIFFSLPFIFLSACGAVQKSDGFFSDANICRPLPLADIDPTNTLSGQFAIPATTGGVTRTAQLTVKETQKKNIWGVEMYLASTVAADAKLKLSTMIKRAELDPTELSGLGPDGTFATVSPWSAINTLSANTTPGWVRAQFPSVVTLNSGDAVWLITEPDYNGTQSVSWYYTAGDGAWINAPGTPVYINFAGVKTVHRLIYCE